MPKRLLVVLLTVVVSLLTILPAMAVPAGNDAFQRTWNRTDQPVASLQVSRTWMWGPEANTGLLTEPFAQAPNGQRTVQYFDKSRMEITDPNGDQNSLWYVTNGLIAKELITGQIQLGEATFQQHNPANVNISGDPDDGNAPTYASFTRVLGNQPIPAGWKLTQTINRAGAIGSDAGLGNYGVTAVAVDAPTNHTVASPFWDFMNSSGVVSENGAHQNAPLFQNPFYAPGYPISEAYWARVKVAGVEKWVLVQAFERRVLTYTPDNADGWKVEAGNVGQHYHHWRYSQTTSPSPSGMTQAQVVEVVDGDTIDVSINGVTSRVRLIGVDTPEKYGGVECYGPEASNFTTSRLQGKTVKLEKDVSETDKYGRLLRYVWVGNELFNETLVRQGYAQVSTYPPDVKYVDRFKAAEDAAQAEGAGLWSGCKASPSPSPSASPSPSPSPTPSPGPTQDTIDYDCGDFATHAEAQAYFDSQGGSASNNVDRLDGSDHDGIVCESLP